MLQSGSWLSNDKDAETQAVLNAAGWLFKACGWPSRLDGHKMKKRVAAAETDPVDCEEGLTHFDGFYENVGEIRHGHWFIDNEGSWWDVRIDGEDISLDDPDTNGYKPIEGKRLLMTRAIKWDDGTFWYREDKTIKKKLRWAGFKYTPESAQPHKQKWAKPSGKEDALYFRPDRMWDQVKHWWLWLEKQKHQYCEAMTKKAKSWAQKEDAKKVQGVAKTNEAKKDDAKKDEAKTDEDEPKTNKDEAKTDDDEAKAKKDEAKNDEAKKDEAKNYEEHPKHPNCKYFEIGEVDYFH